MHGEGPSPYATNNMHPLPQATSPTSVPTAWATQLSTTDTNTDHQETSLSTALDTINEFNESLNSNNGNDNPYTISCRNVSISHRDKCSLHEVIIDLAAWPHLFNDSSYFVSLRPWLPSYPNQFVTLADGVTKTPIEGVGTVVFLTKGKVVKLHNVLYVPEFL